MAGNPNPSPETRFQPGSTPNPGGKTKELKALETEAALMAAKLRHAQLSSMMERLEGGTDALDLLSPDALRLFKDSEDRAHGTPKQAVTHGNDPDNPLPSSITVHFVKPVGGD
jgi:hypothetical protein